MPYASLDEAYDTFGEIRGIQSGTRMGNKTGGGQLGGGGQFGGADQVANLSTLAQKTDRQDLYEVANNYKSDNYNFIYSGKKDWAIINKDISKLEAPTNSALAPAFNPITSSAQSITNDANLLSSLQGSTQGYGGHAGSVQGSTQGYGGQAGSVQGSTQGYGGQAGSVQAGVGQAGTQSGMSNLDKIQNNFIQSNLANATNPRLTTQSTSAEGDSLRNYLSQTGKVVARNPADLRPVTMIPAPQPGANIDKFLSDSGIGPKESMQPVKVGCSDDQCLSDLNHILSCDDCVIKLRKLIGSGQTNMFGLELPDLNLAKVIFWIAIIFLIVAVYEMLNRTFSN